MSTKSIIILTEENEHWYEDCSEYLIGKEGSVNPSIVLEFDKRNIRILSDESDDSVCVELINPDSEIYKAIQVLRKANSGYYKLVAK